MNTKENTKTVTGNVASELTDEKINNVKNVKNELENFFTQSTFEFYKIKTTIKSDLEHVDVKIKDIDIGGIEISTLQNIVNNSFTFCRINWINAKNGWIIFNFTVNGD